MAKFLLSVLRPSGWDALSADPEMRAAIDAVNDAMVSAGIRIFVGGLQPPHSARIVPPTSDAIEASGNAVEDFLNGIWVLEVKNMDEALIWGKRASDACRARVEVRPFH